MYASPDWLALGLLPLDRPALGFDPLHWLALGVVLLAALVVGIAVHELLHVVPLHFVDADYTVTVLPDDGVAAAEGAASSTAGARAPTGEAASPTSEAASPTVWATLQNALAGGLVRVEVTELPRDAPDWLVRVAAALPVVLALPLLLVAAGVLPDPTASGEHVATVLVVAAAACGLPSPADWAVVWHGSRLYRRE